MINSETITSQTIKLIIMIILNIMKSTIESLSNQSNAKLVRKLNNLERCSISVKGNGLGVDIWRFLTGINKYLLLYFVIFATSFVHVCY